MKGIHLSVLPILGVCVLGSAGASAAPQRTAPSTPVHRAPSILDNAARMDANNLDMVVTNHGSFAYDLLTGNAGLLYPKGSTHSVVFAAGPWIGAMMGDNSGLRVAIGEYAQEFAPGPMQDGTFQPDQSAFKSYSIVRGNTTSSDYLNWPVSQGAPVDKDGKPLLLGDATVWSVYNDADPSQHRWGTAPLGVEIQQTTFAFNRAGPIGNVIYLLFEIVNRSDQTFLSTYFSLWSDPDLGGYTDDLVGCDTTLSMGYCYNATNSDAMYGAEPPTVGFLLLRGPAVPVPVGYGSEGAYDTLGVSSFVKYTNGTDPLSSDEAYNSMRGLHKDGTPIHINDDLSLPTTTYAVSGDPVTGSGWLDSNPADRRLALSTGPFDMEPGQTHLIAVAILVGQGSDRLSSISDLRNTAQIAKEAYRELFPPESVGAPPPTYLTQWGSQGAGGEFLLSPVGVATDAAGNVFVADQDSRIKKYTGSGAFLMLWGSFGYGNGQFAIPYGLARGPAGNLYVSDLSLCRIQKFTDTGTYVTQWGSRGSGNGQFDNPLGVATDASGNVYVADYLNHRVQKFTGDGAYLTQWGSYGSGNGQFRYPAGVATDGAGNVYVADRHNHRIQKFTGNGVYLTQWGSFGGGNGQFYDPSGVATDAAGNVYVADTRNYRIQKFDGMGSYITRWGSFGIGDGQFREGSNITTDKAGNIFVADASNRRIQKFGQQVSELQLDVDIDPDVINLKSHAHWLTAYIEASGFELASIDLATVRLMGSVPADPKFATVADQDADGMPDLMVKFSREALDPLLTPGVVELEVTGSLVTGEELMGSDEVRVIDSPAGPLSASVAPNPLNPDGVLRFETSRPGLVRVTIFDVQGRVVRVLINKSALPIGRHSVPIDGRDERGQTLASGLYFYRVEAAGEKVMGRLVVMK